MSEKTDIVMTVEKREGLGKAAAGRLRREGMVPAIVYGGGIEPATIAVDHKAVRDLLKQEAGENTIFLLKLKGTRSERRCMIKELTVHPITGDFLHIDFIRVTRGHKLSVSMRVELEGDCVGVRHGGIVDFMSRELQVEVLPREMFDKFTVDISDLDVGDNLRVENLEDLLPPSARFLEDPQRVVVAIGTPRAVRAEDEAAEEGLEEEVETVMGEAAEPELIRKGKDEDE
jgi:large subunit ribosomal protein L25